MEGWIKLHRTALEHGWLRNPQQWTLWCYLLLKASHKEHIQRVTVNRHGTTTTIEQKVEKGQLLFGRKKAAAETGLSEQNVRTIVQALVKAGSITTQPTNNYSIISIANWSHYQEGSD